MKRLSRVAAAVGLLLGFMWFAGCALIPVTPIPPSQQYSAQAQPKPEPGKALVYFFNDTHQDAGLSSGVRLGRPYWILTGGQDGALIAQLGRSCIFCDNRTYTWVYMAPGQYTLTPMFRGYSGNGESLSVTLAAGYTYYFQVVQQPAMWSQDITLASVAAGDAVRAIQTYIDCHDKPCN